MFTLRKQPWGGVHVPSSRCSDSSRGLNTGSKMRDAASTSSRGVAKLLFLAVWEARSKGFSSLIHPVSTAVMKMLESA